MAKDTEKLLIAARGAAERLHHLSMAYVGSLIELVRGEKMGLIPANYPGLRQCRDFLDLILLCRSEVNALTELLVKAGVFTHDSFLEVVAENYEHMTKEKCKQFGCEVTDVGLMYKAPPADRN